MKDQKKRILELVEQGKLSASEALTLIEGLESEYAQKETASMADHTGFGGPFVEKEKAAPSSALSSKLALFIDTAVKKVKELDIDSAVKKVKEMDLDLNFGQSVSVQHVYHYENADIRDLDIQILNGSVTLQSWPQQDVRAECDIKVYRAENAEQAKEIFIQNTNCSLDDGAFRFYTEKKTVKVSMTLYLPEQQYELVKIKLFSGPIRGENLKIKDFRTKTANGLISVYSFKGEKLEAETANGQIRLAGIEAAHTEAETIHGMIQFEGESERLDVQSFNGNMVLKLEEQTCRTLYAKTATGNVEVLVPVQTAINGELKSNLGSVSADLPDLEVLYEKNDSMQKELRVKSAAQEGPVMNLIADSKTGSITLKER
ncbi:DUF4097 family beta strand repeat-containing protein [Metabacillus sp. JX24]|uniref:DUF4097 family beta strand repeat-containing protein n=1 Tax=Metabacillus sp. JX24 TaxID=3240759 RepID=UPI0035107BDF